MNARDRFFFGYDGPAPFGSTWRTDYVSTIRCSSEDSPVMAGSQSFKQV
jgi:hypothetical protein